VAIKSLQQQNWCGYNRSTACLNVLDIMAAITYTLYTTVNLAVYISHNSGCYGDNFA